MRQASGNILELDQTEIKLEGPAQVPSLAEPEISVIPDPPPELTMPGVKLGTLAGFEETGAPLVTFPENAKGAPFPARSTVALSVRQIGYEVVVVFEQGDLTKPIILGCIRPQSMDQREGGQATLDGEQVLLSAEREIVLRCGKSSITLTQAGKVLIRGVYLLSRSSGVNRIKGGSVQIN